MKKKILIPILCVILLLTFAVSVSSCAPLLYWLANGSTTTTTTGNNDIQNPDGDYNEPLDYTNTFFLVDALFKNFSIFDVDYETAMLSAIRAYVGATGDKYALYYTPEELEAMQAENNGDLYGIGVQVIFDYDEYFMEIVLIMPDSPAQNHLQIGDKVTHIVDGGQKVALVDIVEQYKEKIKDLYPFYSEVDIQYNACYEAFQYAVSKLKGAEGTYAEFVIDRNGTSLDMKIQRAKVKTVSVTAKKSIRDSKVGIVQISQFDLTTPTQFKDCMDSLISSGCNKFIFDVRNNPGGDLASVKAVLSTLLEKDDVILSTKDHQGITEVTKVKEIKYSDSSYSTCNVTKNDIGKYTGYEYVVLANENSASAAELFTAALRDHEIAQIVGTKTYGKGSVQSIISLDRYNDSKNEVYYYGALKLTTMLYFPPCGEGYDGGIGITPNFTVELEGKAAETHFYKLTEDIDNQLQKAVSLLID